MVFEYTVKTGNEKEGGQMDYVELAKFAAQLFFSMMALAGKSAEEVKAMLEEQRKQFNENKPANLPDV